MVEFIPFQLRGLPIDLLLQIKTRYLLYNKDIANQDDFLFILIILTSETLICTIDNKIKFRIS